MNKKIIFSIFAIIIVLAIVFLSQRAYSVDAIKNILSFIEKNAGASLIDGFNSNSKSNNSNNNTSSSAAKGFATDKTAKNLTGAPGNSLNVDAYTANNTVSHQSIDAKTISPIENFIANGVKAVSEVPGKVGESIKSGGEGIQNAISQTTQKISDTEKNISNYISGVANSVVHPGTPQNCETTATQSAK